MWQSLALSRRLELWDVLLFLLANPAWTEESEPDKFIHLYSPLCLKVLTSKKIKVMQNEPMIVV